MTYQTRSPVVFCIFNRPETTKRVFAKIAEARPPALYVVADAPREGVPTDTTLCKQAREIADQVDWECEVTLDYAKTNLGCKDRIYSGISSAFKKYEFAIILEDDCLPSSDFFRFIDTIRDRYENDPQVMHISGTALVRPHAPKQTYYRDSIPIIWGWASWKRAWAEVDLDMHHWPELQLRLKKELPGSLKDKNRFIKHLGKSYIHSDYNGSISTWDYPYFAHILEKKGHCITPLYNLISNIGFGSSSTHTGNSNSPQAAISLDELPRKLIPPEKPEIDPDYSALQLKNLLYRPKKIARRLYILCNRIGLPFKPKLARTKH